MIILNIAKPLTKLLLWLGVIEFLAEIGLVLFVTVGLFAKGL